MSKQQIEIFSIFGEIEAIVAKEMGFRRIEFWDIPPTARFNKFGQPAKFAVIVPRASLDKFEERIAVLRA